MMFEDILRKSADEVCGQIVNEYGLNNKHISISSDNAAMSNVVAAFRQAFSHGLSGPDLAGTVCDSIIANQPWN
jgi:hypothetical protein